MLWNLVRSPSEAGMIGLPASTFSSQIRTSSAKDRAWSMRYGKLGKPSLDAGGRRWSMARGVLYEGGMGDRAEAPVGVMSQILSMKSLNSCLCEERKVFMGSIQCSLAPKVIMFARP